MSEEQRHTPDSCSARVLNLKLRFSNALCQDMRLSLSICGAAAEEEKLGHPHSRPLRLIFLHLYHPPNPSQTTQPKPKATNISTPNHSPAMAPVTFWSTPLQYMNWAARAKPAIFWSLIIGSVGPVMLVRKSYPIIQQDIAQVRREC